MISPIYAIPDIHGQKTMLDDALALIDADGGADACVVFLGDLVDRGPDSRGVIQTLIDGLNAGRHLIILCGNHDELFLNFLTTGAINHGRLRPGLTWLEPQMGGPETLASYGVNLSGRNFVQKTAAAVPQAHRNFLESLPSAFETDDLLFVHAGIKPGVRLDKQAPDDLLWIREPFLSSTVDHGRLVVHGHTSIKHPQHYDNRVNLDGGAGWGRALCPAVFEGRDCWLLSDNGRVPLIP